MIDPDRIIPADPGAFDLDGLEDKYLATGDFHKLKIVQDLIAEVEALRVRVAELEARPAGIG